MSARNARTLRKLAREVGEANADATLPAIMAARDGALGALANELQNRRRLDRAEELVAALESAVAVIYRRSLWGRLTWLVLGR